MSNFHIGVQVKVITKEQFNDLFKEYLKENPNMGDRGFFRSWGWHLKHKADFEKSLKASGIEIVSDKK